MWEKKHIPIFDVSYQGFANDLETDVWACRYFGRRNFNMFVVQSLSKTMTLYGERIGSLHIVQQNKEAAQDLHLQLQKIAYVSYIGPPLNQARIVIEVLTNPELKKKW